MVTRRLSTKEEAAECARLMSSTDPWITLGRDFDASLAVITDPLLEVYVVEDEKGIAGFIVICMVGAFVGYIQTVLVAPDRQGQGIGSHLVDFAEQRIFMDSPNAFLCVSSFNRNAQRLYERLGYEYVGELTDYLVEGYSELLFRKSRGSWAKFRESADKSR